MNVPQPLRDATERGIVIRTDELPEGGRIVVDFGPDAGDATVDVVDDTVIVVTGDQQFEFDLPPEATSVTERNGVLTITE
ncbi:hypothetical protein [Halovivax cerinus]|uniref:Hsp20/alpha crystallin family protein n=1 Tax=Halovivax cerinus TaxID=1487865 RepID=A0ABD5NR03_9EURY|nr:hypothetical protein [Halovivax cerinus]